MSVTGLSLSRLSRSSSRAGLRDRVPAGSATGRRIAVPVRMYESRTYPYAVPAPAAARRAFWRLRLRLGLGRVPVLKGAGGQDITILAL